MPSAHAFIAALRIKSPEFQQNLVEDLFNIHFFFFLGVCLLSYNSTLLHIQFKENLQQLPQGVHFQTRHTEVI